MAHRDRSVVGMLNLLAVDEGAHKVAVNRSSELRLTTATFCRRRGRCYGSRESKRRAWLDAQGHGDDACVKDKERRGRKLPVDLIGVGADGGVVQSKTKSLLQSTRERGEGTGRCRR